MIMFCFPCARRRDAKTKDSMQNTHMILNKQRDVLFAITAISYIAGVELNTYIHNIYNRIYLDNNRYYTIST